MTEREYNIRRRSLEDWVHNQAISVRSGSISPSEWERCGEYYNERMTSLKREYDKSKEKEAEEYFGD
jgi:hypothetical protein